MQQEIRGALHLMYKVYRNILPNVDQEMDRWRQRAGEIPDPELRRQALNSIRYKKFHCQGGAIYALLSPNHLRSLIRLIVAFQTISDYLDNLCDRSSSMAEEDFWQLHRSMLDAIDPARPLSDYYRYHQEREDGGYLQELVRVCQDELGQLPAYSVIFPEVQRLVSHYAQMQTYKHVHPKHREHKLRAWFEEFRKDHLQEVRELHWNEFAAACGSTLGVFALFAAASQPFCQGKLVKEVRQAYFPWLCGLHILLDYLIDQEEDRIGGDLNFVTAYPEGVNVLERLRRFSQQAAERVKDLPQARFHRLVIEGLLGLYLSNSKVKEMRHVRQTARQLLRERGWQARFFYLNGRLLMGHLEQTQPGRG